MVRSLAVTLVGGLFLFGAVFFVFYRDAHTAVVKPADPGLVRASFDQARRDFPGALLPTAVPKGWTVTVARYAPVDPAVTSGPSVLHIGYVTSRTGHRDYVDLEVGADVDDALDPFDGSSKPAATGDTVSGLQELKAADGTLTLRTQHGVTPATGLSGNKDLKALQTLASLLSRS
jgi:hypothetical protein